MSLPTNPTAWAAHLTRMLNALSPADGRFPIKVSDLALDYSAQVYPADPIKAVEGKDLPGSRARSYRSGERSPVGASHTIPL